MAWGASDLLTQVKVRGQFPDADGAFTDADILLLADQAMQVDIFPLILSCKKEYYVWDQNTDIVANTAAYRIPYRAAGSKLRDLWLVDNQGNEQNIPEVVEEEAWRYRAAAGPTWTTTVRYYVRGEHVVLLPTPTAENYSLKFRFYVRRPRLTTTNYASITAIGSNTVTINATPASFVTNAKIDLMRGKPYFDYLVLDANINNIAANVITLDQNVPADLTTSDFVCLSDESNLMAIPVEFQPLLISATLIRLLTSIADPRAELEKQLFATDTQKMLDYLAPRNDGETQRIVNHGSYLRQRRWSV